jgi:hypothetical protein
MLAICSSTPLIYKEGLGEVLQYSPLLDKEWPGVVRGIEEW